MKSVREVTPCYFSSLITSVVDGRRRVGNNSCSSAAFHSMRERSGRYRFIDIFPSFLSGMGGFEMWYYCVIPHPKSSKPQCLKGESRRRDVHYHAMPLFVFHPFQIEGDEQGMRDYSVIPMFVFLQTLIARVSDGPAACRLPLQLLSVLQ